MGDKKPASGYGPSMASPKKYRYLTKYLCLSCRRTFKRPVDGKGERSCPHCKLTAVRMGQKFRPPKLSAHREWAIVEYLVRNGFYYDSIQIEKGPGTGAELVAYPSTMDEAKIFVRENQEHALPREWIREYVWKRR